MPVAAFLFGRHVEFVRGDVEIFHDFADDYASVSNSAGRGFFFSFFELKILKSFEYFYI